MTRIALVPSIALAILVVVPGRSAAQNPRAAVGFGRPTVTPYVSLMGRGGAMNYFNIVRPTLETRALIAQERSRTERLEKRVKQLDKAEEPGLEEFTLPQTGHRVYYSTYSHYFPFNQR